MITTVRVLIGGLFIWAAIAKLIAPTQFFGALLGYELLLPERFLRVVAVTLPWLELLLGGALLANVWAETVRPMVLGLCLMFVAAIAQALVRDLSIDCGCFGGSAASWFNQPAIALARALALGAGARFLCRSLCKAPVPSIKPAPR